MRPFGRWPWCDPLIGPKQNHALFPRVTHHGFSDRRSRPFRINVFITPAVHERTNRTSSFHRQTPYAAAASMYGRHPRPKSNRTLTVPSGFGDGFALPILPFGP